MRNNNPLNNQIISEQGFIFFGFSEPCLFDVEVELNLTPFNFTQALWTDLHSVALKTHLNDCIESLPEHVKSLK